MQNEIPDSPLLSRRQFVAVGAGALVAAASTASLNWLRAAEPRSWIEDVVRSNLPGVRLDDASLAAFVRDVIDADLLGSHARRIAALMDYKAPWITRRLPRVRTGVDTMERQVLTEYLLGSNFFRVHDPRRDTIVYYGLARACSNPFTTLSQNNN